jgi:16S rRNA (uracil1498-N3)-methyltransferase
MSRQPTRLFIDANLTGRVIEIAERDAHYLGNVLRLRQGDELIVFNGRGAERHATVRRLSRRGSELAVIDDVEPLAEPQLDVVLIQSLLKAEAMDTVVQKATELGVNTIHAVKTDFSVIKLDEERTMRRLAHWRRVARSACEQSGRHRPPEIRAARSLAACFDELPADGLRLALHTATERRPRSLEVSPSTVILLVGPEGGFSAADLSLIDAGGFVRVGLGPRVLRAETAAISACAMAHLLWDGNLGLVTDTRPEGGPAAM